MAKKKNSFNTSSGINQMFRNAENSGKQIGKDLSTATKNVSRTGRKMGKKLSKVKL
jgi:hypothetical protein